MELCPRHLGRLARTPTGEWELGFRWAALALTLEGAGARGLA